VENCPFCKILAGELPGTVVYADQICTVLMDIQPINPGHLLVLPNEHYQDFNDLPQESGKHIFGITQKLALAVRKSGIRCEGINLFLADGKVALQEVPHFHLHIIPRFEGDGALDYNSALDMLNYRPGMNWIKMLSISKKHLVI